MANPFYGDVFYAIEQTCHELQISLSFSTLDIVNGRLRSLPVLVRDERISGPFFPSGARSTTCPRLLRESRLPFCGR